MTRPIHMILGACAVLMLPALAEARGMGQDRAMLPGFETMDADGSGQVTLEDFQAALADPRGQTREQMITRLMQEADAEGKLDEDALRAGLQAYVTERREARREMMQTRLFARIDADSDGVITPEEYDAFRNRAAENMQKRGMRGERRMERHRQR